MAITNAQPGEGYSRMETISSGWCASWLSGTAQAWVLASQGVALIISSSEACISEASMDAELLRGLWPPSELSQRRLIFNAHHRGFCFVAFDAPLPDGDPLLCLGLASDYYISSSFSSVSKHVFIKAYRKLAGCACVLKRLPLSTHSLLKRFASLSCCLQSVWLSVSSLLRNGSSRVELRPFLSRCLSWALCCPVCFLE